jgi:hypothetical protein
MDQGKIKFLKGKVYVNLHDVEWGHSFLYMTSKAQTIQKREKYDLLKLKSKSTTKKVQR